MIRSTLIYGSSIALAAFALRWLEYRHAIRLFPTELYNERALQTLGISDREYEVLCLLASGHSDKEIAKRLFVSPNTVKTHLAHLYEKLGVSRRTQAIHKSKALHLIA